MSGGSHIVFIPGDASVDVLEAVKKALNKVRHTAKPLKLDGQYLDRSKVAINNAAPGVRQALAKPLHPIRRLNAYVRPYLYENKEDKAKRVRRELLECGVTLYGLLKSESRTLPKVLHPNEHVQAVVYGLHRSSSVMLVATDERILFIDKKPMAAFLDEVSYEVVSGIQFEIHTLFATLILHTPVRNYDIRYANMRCAEKFARHIEAERLKRENIDEEIEGENTMPSNKKAPGRHGQQGDDYPLELKEDLAGYYWYPAEEEERDKILRGS